jgi:hypothetical protein
LQCQDMVTSTPLGPASSNLPDPFTDQLRLAVAAYLGRFKGLLPRAHRIGPALLSVPVRGARPGPAGRPASAPGDPTPGFTHLQFEALLTAARQSSNPYDFALVAMLGLLGLRIFEATNANVADLGENTATGSCACAARAPPPPVSHPGRLHGFRHMTQPASPAARTRGRARRRRIEALRHRRANAPVDGAASPALSAAPVATLTRLVSCEMSAERSAAYCY